MRQWVEQLADWRFRLSLAQQEPVALYDAVAPRYDRWHWRWLTRSGTEAWTAFKACVAGELRPGIAVLDAGCGTGFAARWIWTREPRAALTLVDAAPGMIQLSSDLPAQHVFASLVELPLPNAYFDLVACTWVLETLSDADAAVKELIRVTKPGGLICCCSVARAPARPTLPARFQRWLIERFWGGRHRTLQEIRQLFPDGHCLLPCDKGQSVFLCMRRPATAAQGAH